MLEKLHQAKGLILEVEEELIKQKGFCPYEVGYALRKIDDAILELKNILAVNNQDTA